MELAILPFDVRLGRQVGSLIPGGLGGSSKDPRQFSIASGFYHEGQTQLGNGHHGSGSVHHSAHRGPFLTNDSHGGDHRAEPVEEVENFRTADSREQVLVAAAEPDDLVGKYWTDDNDLIVAQDALVNRHGDIHGEEPVGQGSYLFGGDNSQGFQGRRVVPFVVKESDRSILGGTFLASNL